MRLHRPNVPNHELELKTFGAEGLVASTTSVSPYHRTIISNRGQATLNGRLFPRPL